MKKKIIISFTLFLILLGLNSYLILSFISLTKKDILVKKILDDISSGENSEKQFASTGAPFVLGAYETNIQVGDGRVANLKSFFRRHNSPLYDSADLIVQVSDQYKFDYRLLPSIAMQESNVCKYIPPDSHNCWGWGIYGDTVTRFDSYDEAIKTVAKGIKEYYIDNGLVTVSAIMKKYTPSSNGSWAHGVSTFFEVLE